MDFPLARPMPKTTVEAMASMIRLISGLTWEAGTSVHTAFSPQEMS